MSKVLILFADGFEEVEALTVLDACIRAGIKVTKCSIKEEKSVTSSHNVTLLCDVTISEVKDDYDLVFLPGGMPGAVNLAQSWAVNELIIKQVQKGYVAAICASPAVVLGPAGLLTGHEATCFPGCENYYPDFHFSDEGVVISGSIITGKSAGHAWPLGFAIVSTLEGEKKAEEVKKSIYYLS